jgi:hypothetical protein
MNSNTLKKILKEGPTIACLESRGSEQDRSDEATTNKRESQGTSSEKIAG